ncbi:MAG: hypothetical protein WKF77_08025 [Planctomycetaceae bacterium]
MTLIRQQLRGTGVLFATTVFVSAFLLFQIQPLISKAILPWFGGTPGVWTTCMLFFQTLLCGGYLYSHVLTAKLPARWQAILHLALLVVSLAFLNILPSIAWKPIGTESPTLRIVLLLLSTVGLPYFILSTTGPLLLRWFSLIEPATSPYRLYALSNAGSLVALLSYPILFEPVMRIAIQANSWSVGFCVFAALCAACVVRLWRLPRAIRPQAAPGKSVNRYPTGDCRDLCRLVFAGDGRFDNAARGDK